MRIVIIGGTGHIGGHLIPMFVEAGIDVTVVSRGQISPTCPDRSNVRFVAGVYKPDDSNWARLVNETAGNADTLIDLLGVDLLATYNAASRCGHVIACGSVWMLGLPRRIPCPAESETEFWSESYRRRWKVIQQLVETSARSGPRFTAILPPNICGPGKIPLETKGGRNIAVHRELARGSTVKLPGGADVLIGPCDACDVAKAFFLAATKPEKASGRIFNVGSGHALTASEFVATYAQIYGVKILIERVSWSQFCESVVPDRMARYHFEAHMCPDISSISEVLGFQPKFTPKETMARAVDWMRSQKMPI